MGRLFRQVGGGSGGLVFTCSTGDMNEKHEIYQRDLNGVRGSPSVSAGENYWVFDAEMQIRGPESIRALGLSVSGIQAALRWGHDANYNTYFFKSGSYWRFSPLENRVESVYPRSMQDWSGIPADVDAAFRDIYGTVQKTKAQPVNRV